MATQTTNIGLSKPDYNDTADIAVINSNMDKIDTTVDNIEKGIAIVSDGNTHSAIAAGEYVYVRDHSTLAEGLYVASSAIAANATLTSSNLTAKSKGIGGEVKSLNDQIGTVIKSSDTVSNIESWLVTVGQTINQGSFKNIQFVVSTASGVFKAKTYMGTLMRYGTAVYGVSLQATSPTDFVQGNCINGTWTWNSINDQIATKASFKNLAAIANNSSATINMGDSSRCLLILDGGSAKDFIICNTTSSGGVTYKAVGLSTNYSISTGTNTLTISNSTGAWAYVYAIIFDGSVTT